MIRHFLALFTLVVATATHAAPPPLAAVPSEASAVYDPVEECPNSGVGDVAPGRASVRDVTDSGQRVTLDVLVVLDGVARSRAQQIVEGVRAAYDPLGLDLRVAYRTIRIKADGRSADGQPTAGWRYALGEVRRSWPAPPSGFDMVHTLTDKDIVDDQQPNRDGSDELTGVASCVGGVKYEGQQHSLTEADSRYHRPGAADDIHVIAAAHEIAHLLGAHHHYGNCAEGRTRDVGNYGSCTVMFPLAVLNSAVFGSLEAAVVRGYALEYARP